LRTALFIALNAVIAFGFALGCFYWIAGAVHPVQSNQDTYRLLSRLTNFIFGMRDPLLIVREGEKQNDVELRGVDWRWLISTVLWSLKNKAPTPASGRPKPENNPPPVAYCRRWRVFVDLGLSF